MSRTFTTICHAGQPQQPGLAQRLRETDGAKVLPTSDQMGFYLASTHQMAPQSTHPIKRPCYSFIDLGRMKGWVGLVGWPVADGLPTYWSPVGSRPSVGQRQFAGQRPAFRPTVLRNQQLNGDFTIIYTTWFAWEAAYTSTQTYKQ